MKFVLQCDCGSTDFDYVNVGSQSVFICKDCGESFTDDQAGHELISEEDFDEDDAHGIN